jgi:hypothetical protein
MRSWNELCLSPEIKPVHRFRDLSLDPDERNPPEIWREEVRKYAGGEGLMEERIPLLDCKWNDVVHLFPFIPQKSLRR